jgi:hypothetical protein
VLGFGRVLRGAAVRKGAWRFDSGRGAITDMVLTVSPGVWVNARY